MSPLSCPPAARALVAAFVLLAPSSACAGDYQRLADRLARAANKFQLQRVAVLPFAGPSGRETADGRIVSERLVSPLASRGGLQVVERSMLRDLLREKRLQYLGVVDERQAGELAKVLDVQALVTGTVTPLKDDRVEIDARLIEARSGRILGAAEARVEQDWSEPMFEDWSVALPPLPSLDLASAASAAQPALAPDCGGAQETVDDLERGLVDLKARYWALRIERGLALSSLTRNPGSEIDDAGIRARFYERLKEYTDGRQLAALSADELERLQRTMKEIRRVQDACRDGGGST